MDERYLRVGVLTKTHGLNGALKVFPTTDEPEVFAPGAAAQIAAKSGSIPVTIETVSRFKNQFIIRFKEFGDINDVEIFKGCDLMMDRQLLPELRENEFFVSDLVDMDVVEEDGRHLGTIREVLQTGANDVYVVATEGKDILIPAIRDCIRFVSVEDNKMTVHLLPGLVE
ncbi:MAG: 16S rRNA processing protein RimM [Lachnospiraceae bacterium]|nr:16S rRNA processing protein RimM [Lachnospiraceae bacterium]